MASGQKVAGGVLSLALVMTMVATPVSAAPSADGDKAEEPAEPAEDEEAPEPIAKAELAALTRARSLVAARMGRSAAAESTRARAEEAAVEAHRDRRAAAQDLDRVVDLLAHAREHASAAREAERAGRDHFEDGVAVAYKFGGASTSALVMAALQSATDVHDLARAVRELDNVLGHSYEDLLQLVRAAEQSRDRVQALQRLREVAQAVLDQADEAIAPVEAAVVEVRATARLREIAVLGAAEVALDAEDAVIAALEAGAVVAASAEPAVVEAFERAVEESSEAFDAVRDPLAPGSARGDTADGPSTELRRRWLANRRGVVAAEGSLPAAASAIHPDLTCPVLDGAFSNDFHFPRSHGRRHLGTDVFGPRGTPVVALADGVITDIDPVDTFGGDRDFGGISVSWTSEVGRFYAAHLDSVADGLAVGQALEAGDVIGTVGTTGNAVGTPPHLHLGWYVDGVAVNPYPTLALVCERD